jgi:hypothetical protein
MGDGLFDVFKRSNWTSFMIHMTYEMDIDYMVVDEMINIKIIWLHLHA